MSEHNVEFHPRVELNLDEIEREDPNVGKPAFSFVVSGQRFELTDPADLDWKELVEVDDPIAFFKFCMPQEQKDEFIKLNVPGWKLGKIVEAFQRYYGLGAKGNGVASRI